MRSEVINKSYVIETIIFDLCILLIVSCAADTDRAVDQGSLLSSFRQKQLCATSFNNSSCSR